LHQLLRRGLRHGLRQHHLGVLPAATSTSSTTTTTSTLVVAATAPSALLALAAATGVLGMTLATAIVSIVMHVGLGAPQLGGLASLVELPDDGVRIQMAGHCHLPLLRVDAALVHAYVSRRISSFSSENVEHTRVGKQTNKLRINQQGKRKANPLC
jgi:hypothetical protein